MKTIKLSSASRPLADYASELDEDILLLTKRDKPVAAIVPLRNVDRESLALSAHPEFLRLIARARTEFRQRKTLSLKEMKKRVRRRRKGADNGTPSRRRRSRRPSRRRS